MKVEFRCQGCQVSESDRTLMVDRMNRLIKYLGDARRAEVVLLRQSVSSPDQRVLAELTMDHAKTIVRVSATGGDEIAAFDRAEVKLKRRLETLKGRLVARSQPPHRTAKVAEIEYPSISRRKVFELDELNPEDAAFRMEMLDHSFYLFRNTLTGCPAVVYRREDGTVGLIDERESAEAV